ncbi:hypothetical protein [Salegentibacter maritimus]|uniref:hypothetical protein n=1 Tax=Salegentibacter maritimus TaxID=2794347 RepID=UPI0018E43570|nr:hypothetical protein [Salegentibacter maritimus]MBI6115965.1 hypothetical protein [Salegentibacter maritimus]
MGKVSDQINEFTQTYSAIVVGMHSDMNQYRREVKSLQDKNIAFEENMYRILSGAKKMEQSNLQISNKIEDRKSEIENFYREIAGSARRIKVISEDVEKATNVVEQLNLKVSQSHTDFSQLKTRLIEEQGKTIQLRSELSKLNSDLSTASTKIGNQHEELRELKKIIKDQHDQLSTHKLLIIGCFGLIAFILVLTIVL